jgi:pimeloyl-ACP methyl ester carboxylesterase
METVDVDGLRIAYERAGTGPAVVLLQGFVADGSTTWRPQIDALSDEFTVVAWDAPGAGGSSNPPESFGMAGYADCLAGFVAGIGLRKPFIVGLSFGGALAIEFCRRHPACFRAMARASAEDLRDALPHVKAPTLLVYGDRDVRAPLDVARHLHSAITNSRLVLPGVGHVCNAEAPH